MLKASIGFFALGLASLFLGWRNLGGVSFDLGRTLLSVFLAAAFATFLLSLALGGRASEPPPPPS